MQFRVYALATSFVIGGAGAVVAQDSARWAGFYGGVSLSAGSYTSSVAGAPAAVFKKDGAALGLYGGYMFTQPGSKFVWGPEFAATGYAGGGTANDATLGAIDNKDGAIASARLRGGYALGNTLVFGHLGLAVSQGGAVSAATTGTDAVAGVSYGIGAEMALSDKWSARIDATHYDFGDTTATFGGVTRARKAEATLMSIGLTRKF